MTTRQPRYSEDEYTRKGWDIYEGQVRSQVEAGNHGRIVALDLDTGAFEVSDDALAAVRQLLARHPDAQVWCVRIGFSGRPPLRPRVLT